MQVFLHFFTFYYKIEKYNLHIWNFFCIFAENFERREKCAKISEGYRDVVRVSIDEASNEHLLSTLSASIEHPLE